MFARIRKAQENNEGGFTLIELLVVMIIIGILAAIAIPAFLAQKNKAKESAAKSDASNIYKEYAAIAVDGDLTAASLPVVASTDPKEYTVTATPTGGSSTTALVKASAGNTVTVLFTPAVTTAGSEAPSKVCVTATPAGGVSAWSAGPAGLKKGGTC